MHSISAKKGFTLIEIMVAIAIITLIVSMVYGSYSVTTRSAQKYKAAMATAHQGRDILETMTGQIRCAYVAPRDQRNVRVKFGSDTKSIDQAYDFFSGSGSTTAGDILHLVTSNPDFKFQQTAQGLYEITYRFHTGTGELSMCRRKFSGLADENTEPMNWQVLADNVTEIELEFFDRHQWFPSWTFAEKKQLPSAVRINLTLEDESERELQYQTTASITSGLQHNRQMTSRTLEPTGAL